MLKIARPVSFLLLSVALCSSGVIFAANETTTPKVGISQQQASLKGVVEDEFGPVAGASVVALMPQSSIAKNPINRYAFLFDF